MSKLHCRFIAICVGFTSAGCSATETGEFATDSSVDAAADTALDIDATLRDSGLNTTTRDTRAETTEPDVEDSIDSNIDIGIDSSIDSPADTGIIDSAKPDTGVDSRVEVLVDSIAEVASDVGSATDGDAAICVDGGFPGLCCCAGDFHSDVVCSASGGPRCRFGSLYMGSDCLCLPDRDTPCCLPHRTDAGGGGG